MFRDLLLILCNTLAGIGSKEGANFSVKITRFFTNKQPTWREFTVYKFAYWRAYEYP